jgi:hypothetical protein
MVDVGSNHHHTTEDKLNRLLDYQRSWSLCAPAKVIDVPVEPSYGRIIAGDVSAQYVKRSIDTSSHITFHMLPSDIRNNEAMRTWTLEGPTYHVEAFAVDPGQDLLILVEIPM